MENTNELLVKLISQINLLESNMRKEFTGINKRLDGIDYELKKLNTVNQYREEYENIPV